MTRLLLPTLLLLALTGRASAAEPAPVEDSALEGEIAGAVDLAVVEALGRHRMPAQGVTITRPEQERFELGAVVDVRQGHANGLPVLAITPGSAAERLGLRIGDRLLAINGHAFAGAERPGDVLIEALAADDGALTLEIGRAQQRIVLQGSADVVRIPSWVLAIAASSAVAASGCGYVSGGAKAVDGVHKVAIVAIDGQPAPRSFSGRLLLPAGRHRLTLAPKPPLGFKNDPRPTYRLQDAAPDMRIPAPDPRPPADPQHLRAQPLAPIEFDIEVAPDTSYQLGARPIAAGAGLQGFVAAETARRCSAG